MAAFCPPSPSRFTDGSFGFCYAVCEVGAAIAETCYRRERFRRDAVIPRETLEMLCYTSTLAHPMSALPADADALLDPDLYAAGRAFSARARAARLWGLAYPSVRDPQHRTCVAVLRLRALNPVIQGPHFRQYWNGQRIDAVEHYVRLLMR